MSTDPLEQIAAWVAINQFLIYAILFAYCAAKSGLLPFFAGLGAQSGLLEIAPVLICVFAGGYLGDEARFHIARRYGDRLVANRPRLGKALEVTRKLMERYGTGYIFIYRYPKGMRTIGALPLGMTAISWSHFTVLNALSAALWAGILVGVGYLFGTQIDTSVITGWSIISLILLVGFGLTFWCLARRIRAETETG